MADQSTHPKKTTSEHATAGSESSQSRSRNRQGRHRSHRHQGLRRSQRRLGWSMAICTLAGLGIGLVLDNAAVGSAIGLTLGLSIGLLLAG